jgi:hypothetical protein
LIQPLESQLHVVDKVHAEDAEAGLKSPAAVQITLSCQGMQSTGRPNCSAAGARPGIGHSLMLSSGLARRVRSWRNRCN